MTLKLYFHPLSSFCHKALIALYEMGAPFEPVIVDLGEPTSRAAFARVWPLEKFPVLRDETRGHTVPESTTIIEYLDAFHGHGLIPRDRELAWQARMWDRFSDNYVHIPMQKINSEHFRPAEGHDPVGATQARELIHRAYAILDRHMEKRTWAVGEAFTLADCAAAPALFYANLVAPIGSAGPAVEVAAAVNCV